MNDILKLEDIEKLMEDSREAAEYQNVTIENEFFIIEFSVCFVFQEVSNLLSGGLSRSEEEDVEEELEKLIRREEQKQFEQLPDVPKHRISSKKNKIEIEIFFLVFF